MPLSVVKDGLYESKETKGIVVREFVPVDVASKEYQEIKR